MPSLSRMETYSPSMKRCLSPLKITSATGAIGEGERPPLAAVAQLPMLLFAAPEAMKDRLLPLPHPMIMVEISPGAQRQSELIAVVFTALREFMAARHFQSDPSNHDTLRLGAYAGA